MSLCSGTRLGLYEVVAPLGAGGMGEVYRARDTKLGREVAVKVLPAAVAADPERVARFEREAKVLAALNHPHIAVLHSMEEHGGRHFLIMELVEGETLAERLQRGPIPVEEALTIALQIVNALEAAHDKGIVHRDLKPANVKITPDEKVKVLDFGLAKAIEMAPAASNLTDSPTVARMETGVGMILGTPGYMSPEQAKGAQADTRSDAFSFGAVLYEMLTGRRAFQGETASEVFASVLMREPDLTALPSNLNPRLQEVLRRCLEKNLKKRWQAVGDLRIDLESIASAPHAVPTPTQGVMPKPPWRRAFPLAITAVVAGALVGLTVWSLRPAPSSLPITRFRLALPDGQQFTNLGRQVVTISPDGTHVVYVANQQLHVRSMADSDPRPISGTEIPQGVVNPVFSPDSRSIAFWSSADRTIKRIAVSGGVPVTLCSVGNLYGMSWDRDGILFGQGADGIKRVSADGGKPEQLIAVKDGELAHGPQMLPGGETLLFTIAAGTGSDRWDNTRIVAYSLRTHEQKTLVDVGSDGRYLPTGHLVYAVYGVLFAIPFDVTRLESRGGAVPIVQGVRRATGFATGTAQFAFSANGTLVYHPGPASPSAGQVKLALADRKGDLTPLELPSGPYSHPRISPDGRHLAFQSDDGKEAIVWVYDVTGATAMRRLTFGGQNRAPIWTADGQRVAFTSDREGDEAIFWQRADGTGSAERLTTPDKGTRHIPESWSPSGESLLIRVIKGTDMTLWTLSLRDRKPVPFGGVQSNAPTNAVFSPDGRWVAYQSGSATPNAAQVYVQPFPSTGVKYQITTEGGRMPLWSPDGRQLFVSPRRGRLAAVSVGTQPSFRFGNQIVVPGGSILSGGAGSSREFDITPDGKFVVVVSAGQDDSGASAANQIQVVLNWFEEVKQKTKN